MAPCPHITAQSGYVSMSTYYYSHGYGYGSMSAYVHSHGAILHSVINMDLDMAPSSHVITHMEPYYTP